MTRKPSIAIVTSAGVPCGIWTFSENVRKGLLEHPKRIGDVGYVAVDKKPGIKHDPSTLITTIAANDLGSYVAAAKEIAARGIERVWLQHEHGIFDENYMGPGIFTEELSNRGIDVFVTAHTTREKPEVAEKADLGHVLQYCTGVFVQNKIATNKIVKAGVYGKVDPNKVMYFPHPVRDVDVSAANREKLLKKFGLEGRFVIGSGGLNSAGKGTDIMVKAICELMNSNDLTHKQKEQLLFVQMGDWHPNFRKYKGEYGGASFEEFTGGIQRDISNSGLEGRFAELPGINEFIRTDLSGSTIVFANHFLNDEEFGESLVYPHKRYLGNQNTEQAVTGMGMAFATAGSTMAVDSLATRSELFLPIKYRRGNQPYAKEMDSGEILPQGPAGVDAIKAVIVESINNPYIRIAQDEDGREKRPELIWGPVIGRQLTYMDEAA